MTLQEREEMFAKDVLTVKDLEKLFCCGYSSASKIMREIKDKCDRIKISGVLHVQDYLDFYKLPQARYVFSKKEKTAQHSNAAVANGHTI